MMYRLLAYALVISFAGCAGGGVPPAVLNESPSGGFQRTAGLGPVVQSKFGGEIFGWDIDQNGSDGILTETVFEQSGRFLNATETFDQPTGKIVKVVRKKLRLNANIEPVAYAIAGNDVGIVDVETALVKSGRIERDDHFAIVNPVTNNRITARSAPPRHVSVLPSYMSDNQASPLQVMTGLYFTASAATRGLLYTYDASRDKWGRRFDFPQSDLFPTLTLLYAAVDANTNEGVVGYLRRASYGPQESPTFDVFDATTGRHLRSFQGLGYGFVNGMAIDPTTDILCTTTLGDMYVEFYHLKTGKGKAVQIPTMYGGGALTSGASVAADPISHLFLVAQRNSTFSPSGGSTVIVYDEKGTLVEYINGFNFLNQSSVVVPRVAVNPANRSGYVDGPQANEIQEFTY